MKQVNYNVGIALLYNLLLFFSFLAFSTPIFNSGDDVFCLYLLSVGFYFSPTELIHYAHLLHPVLTLTLKNLFIFNPTVNWYSWLLITAHFLACSIILYQVIYKTSSKVEGFLFYSVLFVVFECNFLLSISFTNTSVVLTCAALLVLASTVSESSFSTRKYITAVLLLLLAFAFRIYSIIPLVGIALPFLFFPFRQQSALRVTGSLALVVIFIILLNKTHQSYYNKHIPNWTQEERYRQNLYKFFNYHSLYEIPSSEWETEQQLIKYALTIDTTFLNSGKLLKMHNKLVQDRNRVNPIFSGEILKWFFINNRIFFALPFFVLLAYPCKKRNILICLGSFMCIIGGWTFLMVNWKLPDYIVVGCLWLFSTLVYFSSCDRDSYRNKNYYAIKIGCIFFLLFWGIVRICKTNVNNRFKNDLFVNTATEIIKYPKNLFLVSDNSFPLDYFSIFDTPAHFPLKNIIISGHNFTGLYVRILHQFNINSVAAIPHAPNVLLWGKPVPALNAYYLRTTGKKIKLSEPLKEFKYGEVRRIEVSE